MKKIERGTIKHLIILIIALYICAIILYPLFDLLLCKFITNSKFVYSAKSYLVQPITTAIILGSMFWMIDKK